MSTKASGLGPGKFISQSKSRKMLKAYFQYREELQQKNGVPWDKSKDHYAYCFGLDQMQALMQKIESYNSGEPELPIVGVRIYNTRSLPPLAPGDDVLLVPYLSNNKNLIPIDDDLDNDGNEIMNPSEDDDDVLNDPRLCPPYCND